MKDNYSSCLLKIQNCADEKGFKFSKIKSACVHFCTKHKPHNDRCLYLDVVMEVKFLGIIIDNKLSFVPHIKMLKCTKALDAIKVVANSKLGADKIILLHLYRSLVRFKLDYGCIVNESAKT